MSEIGDFGETILWVSSAVFVALVGMRLADRLAVPYAAVFLVGAVLVGELVPDADTLLSIKEVQRVAVLALIVILFNGGLHIGPNVSAAPRRRSSRSGSSARSSRPVSLPSLPATSSG